MLGHSKRPYHLELTKQISMVDMTPRIAHTHFWKYVMHVPMATLGAALLGIFVINRG